MSCLWLTRPWPSLHACKATSSLPILPNIYRCHTQLRLSSMLRLCVWVHRRSWNTIGWLFDWELRLLVCSESIRWFILPWLLSSPIESVISIIGPWQGWDVSLILATNLVDCWAFLMLLWGSRWPKSHTPQMVDCGWKVLGGNQTRGCSGLNGWDVWIIAVPLAHGSTTVVTTVFQTILCAIVCHRS